MSHIVTLRDERGKIVFVRHAPTGAFPIALHPGDRVWSRVDERHEGCVVSCDALRAIVQWDGSGWKSEEKVADLRVIDSPRWRQPIRHPYASR